MGEQTYAELRRARADRPSNQFLSAKDYPNGIEVVVVSTEVGIGFDRSTPVPVWNVTGKEFEGTRKVNESGFMSGKLEDLNIEDPKGHTFVLAQEEYKGQKTFRVARMVD